MKLNPFIQNAAPRLLPPRPGPAFGSAGAPGRRGRARPACTQRPAAAVRTGSAPRPRPALLPLNTALWAPRLLSAFFFLFFFFNHLDCQVIRGVDIAKIERPTAELSNSNVSTHVSFQALPGSLGRYEFTNQSARHPRSHATPAPGFVFLNSQAGQCSLPRPALVLSLPHPEHTLGVLFYQSVARAKKNSVFGGKE